MNRALAGLVGLAGLVLTGPATAACQLALILGFDISSSVDAAEDRLQRQGLARALGDPQVAAALFARPGAYVSLAVFEWSGRHQQRTVLDWTDLHVAADLDRAAATIAASRRSHAEFPTAIGAALRFALDRLASRGDGCATRTIDLSGDGIHNEGFGPLVVYRTGEFDGITVNGLVILGDDPRLLPHYRDTVLRGPGAFIETADGFADFERAMARKLLREIGSSLMGAAVLPGEMAGPSGASPGRAAVQ